MSELVVDRCSNDVSRLLRHDHNPDESGTQIFNTSSQQPTSRESSFSQCITSITDSDEVYSPSSTTQHRRLTDLSDSIETTIQPTRVYPSSEFWGHHMSPPDNTVLRLYSLNVNGFKLGKADYLGGTLQQYCKQIALAGINVSCLQELNVDITQPAIKNIIQRTVSRNLHQGKIYMGHTPMKPYKTTYKPGGTAIILNNSLASRYNGNRIDPWGRWVITILKGRGDLKLAIFSIYQPQKASWQSTAGTNTIVAQQYALIYQLQGSTTTSPREKFQSDLLRELGYVKNTITPHILIAGDFNEHYPSPFFTQLMDQGNLFHLPSEIHPNRSLPPTYFRGIKCLDHAFGSQRFLDAALRCGYEPYSFRFHSDHRALYLDFRLELLFNTKLSPPLNTVPRRLKSQSMEKVVKYIDLKYKYLEEHNFFERLQILTSHQPNDILVEKLDKTLTQASLFAESAIKIFPEPLWSVNIVRARMRVTFFKLCLAEIQHKRTVSAAKQRLQHQYGSAFESYSTIGECLQLLRSAQKHLRQCLKNHRLHREQEFQSKIDKLMSMGDKDSKMMITILRNIRKAEETKQMFKKLQTVLKTESEKTITQIQIPAIPTMDPQECTEWITLDIPEEIIDAIQQRNIKHFQQAHGTPFTIPPLSSALHYTAASGHQTMSILQGTYNMQQLDESTQQILTRLSQIYTTNLEYPQLSSTISLSDMIGKLKKWPETTTTSPSGLHLGHYKALIKKVVPPLDCDEEIKQFYNEVHVKQQKILDAHLQLLNYALSKGFTFSRWQTTNSNILLKTPNDYRIHRLRVIHIFEADYNLFLAVKWRKLLQRTETLSLLNTGQFGSRANKNAHDPVFIEVFQRQISKSTRTPWVQLNFDATSCYDRIIPSLAGLTSMAMGMSSENVAANTKTLQYARYHLKMGNKVNPSSYSHMNPSEVYGSGQGSGNSPFLWCLISSVLFDCFADKCVGATYVSPDSSQSVNLGMIGFVDDSNGQINNHGDDSLTIRNLLQQADHDARLWQSLLSSSGGALEPSKCSFHMVHWKFRNDGSPVLQDDISGHDKEYLRTLPLISTFNSLRNSQSHKTLGTKQIPTGKSDQQFTELLMKAENYRSIITQSSFTREEAYTFYYAILLPSISYAFPTSTMSKKQLHKLQSRCTAPLLAKMGFNRHMSKAVLYAPAQFGGAALRDFSVLQGSAQIQVFVKYWRSHTQLGILIKIMAQWVQQSIGMSKFFLTDVDTPIPHLEADWVRTLRAFLQDNQMHVVLSDQSEIITPIARQHDVHLMDLFLSFNIFSPKQIRHLNYCRLYLNVILLSDITDISGTHVYSPEMLRLHGKSKWHCRRPIYQINPPPRVWKIWDLAIGRITTSRQRLQQTLGPWLLSPGKLSRIYEYYTDGSTLFVRQSSPLVHPMFHKHSRLTSHSFANDSHGECSFNDLPDIAVPTSVYYTDNCYRFVVTPLTPSLISPLSTEMWRVDEEVPTVIQIKQRLFSISPEQQKDFHVASDASVKSGKGAFGWVIAHQSHGLLAIGKGRVPGHGMSSYRAEAWGMLSVLRFLLRLKTQNLFDITSAQWFLECDNLSLITRVSKISLATQQPAYTDEDSSESMEQMSATYYVRYLQANPLIPEWDILNAILQISSLFKLCQVTHIRGHQDTTNNTDTPLSYSAQLNIRCDKLAEQAHQIPDLPVNHTLSSARIQLVTSAGPVTSRWSPTIRFHCSKLQYQRYYMKKYDWDATIWEAIQWDSLSKALSQFSHRKTHLIKLLHGSLPTNAHQFRCGHVSHPNCPLCLTSVEVIPHLLQCQSRQVVQWRETFLKNLGNHLKGELTDPILETMIMAIFQDLCGNQTSLVTKSLPVEYVELWTQQRRLGWLHMLFGRYVRSWETLQIKYNVTMEVMKPKNKSTWTASLIGMIWKEWLKLWDIRNITIHGSSYQESQAILRQELLIEMRLMINRRDHVERPLRDTIPVNIPALEKWSTTRLTSWFTVYKEMVDRSLQSFAIRCVRGIRPITEYFTRPTPSHQNAYFQDVNAPPWEGGLRPPSQIRQDELEN